MIENNGVQNTTHLFGCSSDSLNAIILLPNEVDIMSDWNKTEEGKRWQKAYMNEYYKKHKEKLKEDMRNWRKDNKEKKALMNKEWRKNNPDKYRNLINKWMKENRNKVNILQQKQREKYPERYKAYNYSKRHNQRDDLCSNCGKIEDLHFHHTDYKKREGFTLCMKCHKELHNRIKCGKPATPKVRI